jgi:hypothetical protein
VIAFLGGPGFCLQRLLAGLVQLAYSPWTCVTTFGLWLQVQQLQEAASEAKAERDAARAELQTLREAVEHERMMRLPDGADLGVASVIRHAPLVRPLLSLSWIWYYLGAWVLRTVGRKDRRLDGCVGGWVHG